MQHSTTSIMEPPPGISVSRGNLNLTKKYDLKQEMIRAAWTSGVSGGLSGVVQLFQKILVTTFVASLWRMFLTPIDLIKTNFQVHGKSAYVVLKELIVNLSCDSISNSGNNVTDNCGNIYTYIVERNIRKEIPVVLDECMIYPKISKIQNVHTDPIRIDPTQHCKHGIPRTLFTLQGRVETEKVLAECVRRRPGFFTRNSKEQVQGTHNRIRMEAPANVSGVAVMVQRSWLKMTVVVRVRLKSSVRRMNMQTALRSICSLARP
ncbi:unnamed protein product [Bathycoccus prasinos]